MRNLLKFPNYLLGLVLSKEWMLRLQQPTESPKPSAPGSCHPHLNALVDEFLYRWTRGEIAVVPTVMINPSGDGEWWYAYQLETNDQVEVWIGKSRMEIRVKDIATIKIADFTHRIEKYTGRLEIDWLTSFRCAHPYSYLEFTGIISKLLDKPTARMEPIMNNETRGLSAGELTELTNSTHAFWQRISGYAIPGMVCPDRQGYDVKFDYKGLVDDEQYRRFIFTRLQDKVEFKLTFSEGATPAEVIKVKVEFDKSQIDLMTIIIVIGEALKPDEYYIGGTNQKVTNGVGEPLADTLKRAVAEFLDKAPFVSTTTFVGQSQQFQLGDRYVIAIGRFNNVISMHLYNKLNAELVAKIGYTQDDRFTWEAIRSRIQLVDLIRVFNFQEFGITPLFESTPDRKDTDAQAWKELFDTLLKTTSDQFAGGQPLWQDQAGFYNSKEVRTCGYIRKIGSMDTLELTIRYEGNESHAHDGKVVIQYALNNGLVTRLDRNNDALLNLGMYYINNYLHKTAPVEKNVLEEHRIKPLRDVISECYNLMTGQEFFKNVRGGVVPKDVRTALGYTLYLTRIGNDRGYAPVKVEVFAGNDVSNPLVFFQGTYALDGMFYYDPDSFSGTNLEKYLELVKTIVEQEKKAWQYVNSLSAPGGSQSHPHDYVVLEPQLLNETGTDISDEWVAWHVRQHNSSLGMAVKAGLEKMHQLRDQFDNVINNYGK
ncbi:hypothetical protein D3C81_376410 [compost metagenome]